MPLSAGESRHHQSSDSHSSIVPAAFLPAAKVGRAGGEVEPTTDSFYRRSPNHRQ